jgi:hypothetical protein
MTCRGGAALAPSWATNTPGKSRGTLLLVEGTHKAVDWNASLRTELGGKRERRFGTVDDLRNSGRCTADSMREVTLSDAFACLLPFGEPLFDGVLHAGRIARLNVYRK